MISVLKKYSNNVIFDTLKELANEIYHKYGVVSIPVSLERDKSGKVVKKITAKWGELVSKENLSWEDIEQLWEATVSIKRGGKLIEDYKKILRHRGIAILTGAISGLTVVDVDDEEEAERRFGKDRWAELQRSTLVIKTPNKGKHLYFKYDPDLPTTTNILPKIDIRNDKALVVTYPSTVWDEATPCYELVNEAEPTAVPEWLKEILLQRKKEKDSISLYINKEDRKERRSLSTRELSKLGDLFTPLWKEGHRHNLTQYIAGFLYKQGIGCESIRKLIEKIVYSASDEEAERRLKFVDYECERFEGVSKEDIKGYAGIKEELEALVEEGVITESGYLHILEELNNLFPPKKEKRDDIFVRIGDSPKWGYASLSKYDAIKEWKQTEKEGFVFKSTIAWGHIVDLEVVRPPTRLAEETDKIWNLTYSYAGEIYKFKGTPAEVLGALEENGFLINTRKAKEAFMAILGKIEREKGIQKKWLRYGIFPTDDGGIVLNHPELEGYEPTDEEIVAALKTLDIYVSVWSERKLAEVSTVVKFAIASPFYFVRKVFTNRPWQWLALVGESDTGKTEDARLTKRLWNVPYETELNTSSIQTEARLAKQTDSGTFALIVNETTHLFDSSAHGSSLQEMLKSIWGDIVARTHLSRNRRQRVSFALAPFVFTSNNPLKLSSSLAKRIKVVNYPLSAKVTPEEKKDFSLAFPEGFLERQLKPLAKKIYDIVASNIKLLTESDTFEDFAEILLEDLYSKYLNRVPEWVKMRPEETEVDDEATATGLDIIHYILEFVNVSFKKFFPDTLGHPDVLEKIAKLQAELATFPVKYDASTEEVIITKDFLTFLKEKGIEAPSLRWLKEKLENCPDLDMEVQFTKTTRRSLGISGKRAVIFVAKVLSDEDQATKSSLIALRVKKDLDKQLKEENSKNRPNSRGDIDRYYKGDNSQAYEPNDPPDADMDIDDLDLL